MESLEPRSRVLAGFEWGLPSHVNLMLGIEHAPLRQLSGTLQVRRRFTGWSIEGGAKLAPVVSPSAGLVVALLADARYNTDPGYVALRPQLGLAKRLFEDFELHVQGGGEVDIQTPTGVTWIAGAHLHWRVSGGVGLFVESIALTRHPQWPGGALQFTTGSAGLRFFVGPPRQRDMADAFVGAWVPMYRNYWDHALGAAVVRSDLYLDDVQ